MIEHVAKCTRRRPRFEDDEVRARIIPGFELNPIPVHPALAVFRTAKVTSPCSPFASSGRRSILYLISNVFGSPALGAGAYEAPAPSKKDAVAYVTSFDAAPTASARDTTLTTHVHTVARDDHPPRARVVIVVIIARTFGDAPSHGSFPRRPFATTPTRALETRSRRRVSSIARESHRRRRSGRARECGRWRRTNPFDA